MADHERSLIETSTHSEETLKDHKKPYPLRQGEAIMLFRGLTDSDSIFRRLTPLAEKTPRSCDHIHITME